MARKYVRVPENEIDKDTGPLEGWGSIVVVTKGIHRGKIGEWDDEGATEDDCIIYFGMTCLDDREHIVKASKLRPATKEEAALYFKNRQLLSDDPELRKAHESRIPH